MKALKEIADIQEAYNDAIKAVQQSSLTEKALILNELEELYKSRIAEIDATKEQEHQSAIFLEKKKEEEERNAAFQTYLVQHYDELCNSFLMTTGNDFSGYEITDYLGVISDGVVQGTGWISELSADLNDLFGAESNSFAKKMKMCREAALNKAKDSAIRMGANALVSIDFETTTFRNNMIGIMVSGTAVIVEKVQGSHSPS